MEKLDSTTTQALFEYILRIGDDRLILGSRVAEWCGHAPILEEDIALANIALDLIGQSALLLKLAGEIEGKSRSADDLAYFREVREFRNIELVEQPRGDFAATIARQFVFDCFSYLFLEGLKKSRHAELSAIAEKSFKETVYHLRHSSMWVHRLGDGTSESHSRIEQAFEEIWSFTGELFYMDQIDQTLISKGIAIDLAPLQVQWQKMVQDTFKAATLVLPSNDCYMARGSRTGRHGEHLGHMLAEMQIMPRSFPDARW